MAINVSFNGSTIYKPGAYSKSTIDLGGNLPIGPAGLVAVIGEADAGMPGANEVDIRANRFTADQLQNISDKYRNGPIVDAANFLFAPAADAAIPSGAQQIWIYKTNNSTQAELDLAQSYGAVKALEYGLGGNAITYKNVLTAETPATITGGTFNGATVSISSGAQFSIYTNGVKHTWTCPGDSIVPANPLIGDANILAALQDIANWSPAGLPSVVFALNAAAGNASQSVTVTMSALATANRLGYGRNFELVDGISTPMVALHLASGLNVASIEPSSSITINNVRDGIQENDIMGGNIVLKIGFSDVTATSAKVTVTDSKIQLVVVGGLHAPASTGDIEFVSYATLDKIVQGINLFPGWTASVSDTLYNPLAGSMLDHVIGLDALSPANQPAQIKKDASEVADFFAASNIVEIDNQVSLGLPEAVTSPVALTGGTKGATNSLDIVNALDKFTKFHVNFILPLFSRDATADASDGLTDGTSSYTIDGIHQAVKTHISLMKTTKKRSERQSVLSYKDTFAKCQSKAGNLNDGRLQLVIQDVRQTDAQGNIRWFQPWALAAMITGARSGSPIGTPLTFKFLNVAGIRHTAQPMTTSEANIVQDFDPDTQYDDAIQSGISFLENPQTGGFRLVVDNTTYGVDSNFVWNRGNVVYAADIVAFNFRNQMEALYVGKKNTISVAEVSGTAGTILSQFLNQGITVSTPDAPSGYKQLSVRIVGNTIYVTVTIKLVEGIDFVLADITIQRAQQ